VADEEAVFVVVGIDEPAGDVVGRVVADFARGRVVHVHAVNLDDELFRLLFRRLETAVRR
jgi:hypothetical protein